MCSGLVSLSSQRPLGDQLMQQWGGGVELHSWSVLPTGSGLGEKPKTARVTKQYQAPLGDGWRLTGCCPAGTSSILAGALLAAVYRCTGRTYDTDSLIHAVLYLEQILTTGSSFLYRSSSDFLKLSSCLASSISSRIDWYWTELLLLLQVEAGRIRWGVWWVESRWVAPERLCPCRWRWSASILQRTSWFLWSTTSCWCTPAKLAWLATCCRSVLLPVCSLTTCVYLLFIIYYYYRLSFCLKQVV